MSLEQLIPSVLEIKGPISAQIPLVFDSPHSGTDYPQDFEYVLAKEQLRFAEDTHVHDLFEHAGNFGAPFLHALFPRSYIDPNRSELDFDPVIIDGQWPVPLEPSSKARLGIGLVWTEVRSMGLIYDRKLTVDEVRNRIEKYWRPYHQSLEKLVATTYDKFGSVLHVNLHSMRNQGVASDPDGEVERCDFVIGDLHHRSCNPDITEHVVRMIKELGYTVALNFPYSGQLLVSRYSDPGNNKHSIQIEINRRLYMNEMTRKKHKGYRDFKNSLNVFIDNLAQFVANGF